MSQCDVMRWYNVPLDRSHDGVSIHSKNVSTVHGPDDGPRTSGVVLACQCVAVRLGIGVRLHSAVYVNSGERIKASGAR